MEIENKEACAYSERDWLQIWTAVSSLNMKVVCNITIKFPANLSVNPNLVTYTNVCIVFLRILRLSNGGLEVDCMREFNLVCVCVHMCVCVCVCVVRL